MKKKRSVSRWRRLEWPVLAVGSAISLGLISWQLLFKPFPMPADDSAFWRRAKESREIHIGIAGDEVVAMFWSPFEPAELRELLLDVEGYPAVFPTIPKMTLVARSKDSASAAGTMSVLGPLTVSFAFALKAEDAPRGAKALRWEGTGTALRSNAGSWLMRDESGGSAVITRLNLVPAGRLVPVRVWCRLLVPFARHSLSFLGVHA